MRPTDLLAVATFAAVSALPGLDTSKPLQPEPPDAEIRRQVIAAMRGSGAAPPLDDAANPHLRLLMARRTFLDAAASQADRRRAAGLLIATASRYDGSAARLMTSAVIEQIPVAESLDDLAASIASAGGKLEPAWLASEAWMAWVYRPGNTLTPGIARSSDAAPSLPW
jgi:hypothetical protein